MFGVGDACEKLGGPPRLLPLQKPGFAHSYGIARWALLAAAPGFRFRCPALSAPLAVDEGFEAECPGAQYPAAMPL